MIKILLVILFVSMAPFLHAQPNVVQTAVHWKLYNVNTSAALRYSLDTLLTFSSTELPADSMAWYCASLKAIAQNTGVAWMGGYYATCEINHVVRKMDISAYGGFLYDEQDKQYYELPVRLRDQWMAFVNRRFHSIAARERR